jgi:hypothetical protein
LGSALPMIFGASPAGAAARPVHVAAGRDALFKRRANSCAKHNIHIFQWIIGD